MRTDSERSSSNELNHNEMFNEINLENENALIFDVDFFTRLINSNNNRQNPELLPVGPPRSNVFNTNYSLERNELSYYRRQSDNLLFDKRQRSYSLNKIVSTVSKLYDKEFLKCKQLDKHIFTRIILNYLIVDKNKPLQIEEFLKCFPSLISLKRMFKKIIKSKININYLLFLQISIELIDYINNKYIIGENTVNFI